jgi:hypothetical protein
MLRHAVSPRINLPEADYPEIRAPVERVA